MDAGRHGQVGGDADEGAALDDLPVAGPDRHGRPERLLRRRDHLRAHQLVALAGRYGGPCVAGARLGRCRGGPLRQLGEGRVTRERDVDRRADESRSGKPGQHARPEPAQADAAAIDIARPSAEVERRLVADLDPVSRVRAVRAPDVGPGYGRGGSGHAMGSETRRRGRAGTGRSIPATLPPRPGQINRGRARQARPGGRVVLHCVRSGARTDRCGPARKRLARAR